MMSYKFVKSKKIQYTTLYSLDLTDDEIFSMIFSNPKEFRNELNIIAKEIIIRNIVRYLVEEVFRDERKEKLERNKARPVERGQKNIRKASKRAGSPQDKDRHIFSNGPGKKDERP